MSNTPSLKWFKIAPVDNTINSHAKAELARALSLDFKNRNNCQAKYQNSIWYLKLSHFDRTFLTMFIPPDLKLVEMRIKQKANK